MEDALRHLYSVGAGKGSSNRRVVVMTALRSVAGCRAALSTLLDGLSQSDTAVAESASIELEFCDDPAILDELTPWLQRRMRRPRTRRQARVTANVIATCLRLGDRDSRARLMDSSAGWDLVPIEGLALSGQWEGHRITGDYPWISWPFD